VARIVSRLKTVSPDVVAAFLLASTIFTMVLGSGSTPEIVGPGRKLRWIFLFALAVYACWLAVRRGQQDSSPLLVWSLGRARGRARLGFVSTAWSVDPRLTFGRAGSFALLMTAAGALAFAVRFRPQLRSRLLLGVLAGSVGAALGGIGMYIFEVDRAVQPASGLYPARFRGLGQNPNTVAMLLGLTVPLSLWALSRARGRTQRTLAGGAFLLLMGSITASGSRGALVAALGGGLIFALFGVGSRRERLALSLSIVISSAAAAGIMQIPQPLPHSLVTVPNPHGPGTIQEPAPVAGAPLPGGGPNYGGRLQDELYRVQPAERSLFTSSGRLKAWYTAIQQADARPILGFGFGTENKVFVSRVYGFEGTYVENSFIGFYLQLGAVGLLSIVALSGLIAAAAVSAVRHGGAEGQIAALVGAAVAGFVLMLFQSYMYSVGNVATVTFWTACMLLVSGVGVARPMPVFQLRRRRDAVAPA